MSAPNRIKFLDLEAEKSAYDASTVVILPVPYERTTGYVKGTKDAPRAVIAASCQVETFDDELCRDLEDVRVHTFETVQPQAGGPQKSLENIRDIATRIISDGKFIVAIGGEHTITFPLVQAAANVHGPLTVLQIDAHLDLRDVWEGSRWNHACVMRRVMDEGHTVVPVGIRNVSAEEHAFLAEKNLKPFFARDIVGREGWIKDVLGRLAENRGQRSEVRSEKPNPEPLSPIRYPLSAEAPVYITIDVDGLDPSVIRSVGTPEPGGLGWYETLNLLRQVFQKNRVLACDVVELAPNPYVEDAPWWDEASTFATARLVAKLIAYHEFLKK